MIDMQPLNYGQRLFLFEAINLPGQDSFTLEKETRSYVLGVIYVKMNGKPSI